MDTSDPEIIFDEKGECNNCRSMEARMRSVVRLNPAILEKTIQGIKTEGRDRRYDCILGVSGGVDSTYLAYLTKSLGLRPLAVHLDNGWNSELAVKNIELVLNKLKIDLYTHVLDWNSFRDLQVAFLKASTPDSEIPTDHAITGTLFQVARQEKIRTIIQGMNMRTEGIMPRRWSFGAYDWRYIKGIQKRFGTIPLKNYPHFSLSARLANFAFRRLRVSQLLNMIDYRKADAVDLLQSELGWRNYSVKHGESIYTRFYQSYILPRKFGIDKRRAHLSALIVSGQITRDKALHILDEPPYTPDMLASDLEYVIKKLKLKPEEFEEIMKKPPLRYEDYPNQDRVVRMIGVLTRGGRRMHILSPTSGL